MAQSGTEVTNLDDGNRANELNDQNSTGARGSLTRVTVNFRRRPYYTLVRLTERNGDSITDVLNQAAQVMDAWLVALERAGGDTLPVVLPDGTKINVRLIG